MDIISHLRINITMGKVINTSTPAKNRATVMRLLAAFIEQSDLSKIEERDFRDKAAFICLSLIEIEKSIDDTARAWEKRDYWLKADMFRKDWGWVNKISTSLQEKIENRSWNNISEEIENLKEKLSSTVPTKRISKQEYWRGAYQTLQKK
jgi:hypothetical protein